MDWPMVRLDKLYKIGSSKRVLKSQWESKGVPFYRGREITLLAKSGYVDNDLFISEELYLEYAAKYGAPEANDIVITAIGTIGNSYVVRAEDRFYFKDASVLWLKKTSNIDSSFINLWLKSPLMRAQLDNGNGATVDTLTIKKLQSLQVKLPPIPEQQRIVAILDQAFAEIEKARANAEQNLKNARELFDSYLQQVFSQRGEGWVETSLGQEIELLTGYAFKSKDYTEHPQGIPLIRGDNVVQGKIRWDGVKRWPKEEVSEYTKYQLEDGDILLAMDRTWVKAGMKYAKITSNDLPALLVQRVARMRVHSDFNEDYLFHLLGSKLFESYVLSIQTGLGVPHISGKQIEGFQLQKPPLSMQKEIISKVNRLSAEVEKLEACFSQKLISLDELKKSLLQKAFSGELTKTEGQAA